MYITHKLALASVILVGATTTNTAVNNENPLTPACEEALALSALPQRLRDGASVYVLDSNGYKLARKGDGTFTCIVERNHRMSLIPQCPDAAGADTLIPGIIAKSMLALEGVIGDERAARFQAAVNKGDFVAPTRSGISYMMSNFNYIWSPQRDSMIRVPPHVMFYAPEIANEDIGGSFHEGLHENRGVPFIIEEGIHGYMTSFVEHPSDSSQVLAACKGQIPAEPPTLGQNEAGARDDRS